VLRMSDGTSVAAAPATAADVDRLIVNSIRHSISRMSCGFESWKRCL
jgi:hypothetical protein